MVESEPFEIEALGGDTATPRSLRKRVALIESLVELPGKRVLDCGCGAGSYVRAMGESGADAVGIEFQRSKVDEFRKLYPGDQRVRVGDIEHLEFASQSFDVVLMNETIEHIPDDRQALASVS